MTNEVTRKRNANDVINGSIHPTLHNGNLEVINYVNSKHVEVRFVETGTIKTAQAGAIRSGLVRDPNHARVCGVGFNGIGKHPRVTSEGKPTHCYNIWQGMLSRVFNENNTSYPSYGGDGYTVDPIFHSYQRFADWASVNYVAGGMFTIIDGSKVYSPSTCAFVVPPTKRAKKVEVNTSSKTQPVTENNDLLPLVEEDIKGSSLIGSVNTVEEVCAPRVNIMETEGAFYRIVNPQGVQSIVFNLTEHCEKYGHDINEISIKVLVSQAKTIETFETIH